MTRPPSLRLRAKVLGVALILAAVAVAVGFTGVVRIAELRDSLQESARIGLHPARTLDEAQQAFESSRQHVIEASTTTDEAQRASELAEEATSAQLLSATLTRYAAESGAPLPEDVATALQAYLAAVAQLRAGAPTEFSGVYNTAVRPAATTLSTRLESERSQLNEDAQHGLEAAVVGADRAITIVVVVGLVGIAGGLAAAWYIADRSVRRVRRLRDGLAALAVGDLTGALVIDSRDEIGQASAELNSALAGLRRLVAAVAESSTSVAVAGAQVSTASISIGRSADSTSDRAVAAARSADQVSDTLQSLARSTAELGGSIAEISSGTAEVTRVAGEAVDLATQTNRTVSALGESSAEIGEVVRAITAIAEQTNLLALNATIEAARAGAAGKGFAVVAGEVKELSLQTAKATEDIGRRVQRIQDDTTRAVEAINEIGVVITGIADHQRRIATAVSQQNSTTEVVTRDIAAAAEGGREIAAHVSTVAAAALLTTSDIEQSRRAAEDLNARAAQLAREVGRFRR